MEWSAVFSWCPPSKCSKLVFAFHPWVSEPLGFERWCGILGYGRTRFKDLHHQNVVDTCNGIFCCCRKGDSLHRSMAIGIPGTENWRQMPTYYVIGVSFSGMTFDSSTRRFTLIGAEGRWFFQVNTLDKWCLWSRRKMIFFAIGSWMKKKNMKYGVSYAPAVCGSEHRRVDNGSGWHNKYVNI